MAEVPVWFPILFCGTGHRCFADVVVREEMDPAGSLDDAVQVLRALKGLLVMDFCRRRQEDRMRFVLVFKGRPEVDEEGICTVEVENSARRVFVKPFACILYYGSCGRVLMTEEGLLKSTE